MNKIKITKNNLRDVFFFLLGILLIVDYLPRFSDSGSAKIRTILGIFVVASYIIAALLHIFGSKKKEQ